MNYNPEQIDRIIEMAWEDRTPYEAILFQFQLTERGVIKLMRSNLKTSSFKNGENVLTVVSVKNTLKKEI